MRLARLFSSAALLLALIPVALCAKDSPDVVFLQRLFAAPAIDASLFDGAFVQRVPLADVQTLVDDYRRRLGPLRSVAHDATGDQLSFVHGSLRATVELDAAGKAADLRFHDEQSPLDRRALVRVLRARHVAAAWFTQGFLDQLSASDVDARAAQLTAAEGSFVRVDSRAGVYYAIFKNAENIVEIQTSASGKIAYFAFGAATPTGSP